MGKSLGNMIHYYRKRSGLTQERLGELCGVTSSCISRLGNDSLHPKRDNILQLAKIFDIYEVKRIFILPVKLIYQTMS